MRVTLDDGSVAVLDDAGELLYIEPPVGTGGPVVQADTSIANSFLRDAIGAIGPAIAKAFGASSAADKAAQAKAVASAQQQQLIKYGLIAGAIYLGAKALA